MADSSFNMMKSIKSGYSFLADEWKYMAKISWPALLALIVTTMFVSINKADASIFEKFLWEFPSTVLIAFVIFQQTRLILIGERIESLPENPKEYQMRAKDLIVSISFYILFAMLLVSFQAIADKILIMSEVGNPEDIDHKTYIILGALLFLFIWSIRLSILPIIGAVGYPVKEFLKKVSGTMFSLRVMAVSLIACLPVLFLYVFLLSSAIKDPRNTTDMEQIFAAFVAGPIALILVLIINSSLTFALKDILGKNK